MGLLTNRGSFLPRPTAGARLGGKVLELAGTRNMTERPTYRLIDPDRHLSEDLDNGQALTDARYRFNQGMI